MTQVTGSSTRSLPNSMWLSMLLRALPALVGALVIVFTQDHNARFGLAVFGAVTLWTGIIIGFEGMGLRGHPARVLVLVRALITVLAGGFAVTLAASGAADVRGFILLVAIWALVTGLIELAGGLVARTSRLYAREILFTGALTLLLGVAVAFVPPNLNVQYGGRENVSGALTADVQAIGFVGAYFAVLGVMLVIEALSLRRLSSSREEK